MVQQLVSTPGYCIPKIHGVTDFWNFLGLFFLATNTHMVPWHWKHWVLSLYQDLDIWCYQYSEQHDSLWDGEIKVFYILLWQPNSWLVPEMGQWKCTIGLAPNNKLLLYFLFMWGQQKLKKIVRSVFINHQASRGSAHLLPKWDHILENCCNGRNCLIKYMIIFVIEKDLFIWEPVWRCFPVT